MKVSKIKSYIEEYKNHLTNAHDTNYGFISETMTLWGENWNVYAENLSLSYDLSLVNHHSARLWGGSRDSARSVMIALIKQNPEMLKIAFLDLFSHDKDIGLRIGRFIHYCDETLEEIRQNTNLINAHYHDKSMISLYLTLESPMDYCLFDYPVFHKCMSSLESLKIPTEHETDRYYKSLKGIMNLCRKDGQLMSLYKTKTGFNNEVPFIFMNDFMEFIVT